MLEYIIREILLILRLTNNKFSEIYHNIRANLFLFAFSIFIIICILSFTGIIDIHSLTNKENKETYDEKNINKSYLEIIDFNVKKLIKHIDKKYKSAKGPIRDGIDKLKNNYSYKNVIEYIPKANDTDTSYTINKGEVVAICLKEKGSTSDYHDMNTVMFVTIHELAHIFSVGYGHEDEFWINFKFLLEEAVEIGVYTFEDYKKNNKRYCGLDIKYNPISDVTSTDSMKLNKN